MDQLSKQPLEECRFHILKFLSCDSSKEYDDIRVYLWKQNRCINEHDLSNLLKTMVVDEEIIERVSRYRKTSRGVSECAQLCRKYRT